MLKISPTEIESYLRGKGVSFRKRQQKIEADLCPFCEGGEKRDKRTFVVYTDADGGNYKCLRGSCDVSGSFWQLAEFFGDDPKQFYEMNNRPVQMPIPKREVKKTFVPLDDLALLPLTDDARVYLHKRGFTDELLDSVSIGSNSQGQICFEYYHKGEMCLVKYRLPKIEEKKTVIASKDGLWTLWGLEQCDDWDTLVVTFGEYDRMACRQARVNNVVSVPGGDTNLDWIDICWDELQRFKTIILWPDNDKSGQDSYPKIAQRLGSERVRVVKTDYKDANQMLGKLLSEKTRDEAENDIYELVMSAEWHINADIIRVVDIVAKEQDFTGYLTGLTFLNKALHGFLKGQTTVHTGDSKSGKSTILTQITAQGIAQGAKVCAWSGEDDDESYKYRMDIHVAGFKGTEIKTSKAGREYAKLLPEYRSPVDRFLSDNLYLLNKRVGINEHQLAERFELAYKRFGCDVFVVDNLMKIVASKDTNQIYFRQAQIINTFSDFAKTFGVHVHICTHTNKAGGENEPPTKNSVSGAKEITNLADIVLAWWRVPETAFHAYPGDAVGSILANRVFGEETQKTLLYDWRVKRFGETIDDLHFDYL